MTQAAPGAALTESLGVLRLALHSLKAELQLPAVSVESRFRNLSAVIKGLEKTKPAKTVSNTTEYVNQWNDVVAGQRKNLEPRAVRSLCWNPAIVTDREFQFFLARTQHVLTAPSLQGMICSCHARWSRELAVSESVAMIRDHLFQYSGRNRLLNKWKE